MKSINLKMNIGKRNVKLKFHQFQVKVSVKTHPMYIDLNVVIFMTSCHWSI